MYIGISVNLSVLPSGCLRDTGLSFEHLSGNKGVIYARKGETLESLLIPSYELEKIKGFIRRLPIEVYSLLNDDFGVHECAPVRIRPNIKIKSTF